jgi:hypothetical protein
MSAKPCLIPVGRQGHRANCRDTGQILEHYPGVTFSVLDGTSHSLQIAQERLFNPLAAEWLDRIAKPI